MGQPRRQARGGSREARRKQRRAEFAVRGPGPGEYSQELLPGPARSATIGKGQRPPLNPAGNNVPGPGMYGVPQRIDGTGSKDVTFTKSTDPAVKPNTNPGPGY